MSENAYMGWRDRDYAKFTDQEFDSIYGSPARFAERSSRDYPFDAARRSSRPGRASALALVSVAGAAVLFGVLLVTGHLRDVWSPSGGPLSAVTPRLLGNVPVPVVPTKRPIIGTRTLQRGGILRLHGTHTPEPGTIVIAGQWGSEQWVTYGTEPASKPSYSLRIPITRSGVLHLKVSYPDGSVSTGTYQVT